MNLPKCEELENRVATTRPHIVLGTVAADDADWASCDLVRVFVRPEELAPDSPLASGVRERERRMLFAHLPLLSANMRDLGGVQGGMKVGDMAVHRARELAVGVTQANANAVATARRAAEWQCGRDRVREPTEGGCCGVL